MTSLYEISHRLGDPRRPAAMRSAAGGPQPSSSAALLVGALFALFIVANARVTPAPDVVPGVVLGLAIAVTGMLSCFFWRANRPFVRLMVFLVAMGLARTLLIASGVLDLSADETHYWEWSRRLDWSFYSKPPGIALIIATGTAVFGDTAFGVRAFGVIFSSLASLAMYHLGMRLYGAKVGAWSAALVQLIPLLGVWTIGMTPDSPLVFFWTLTLVLFHWALTSGRRRAWLAFGLALGLGIVCKVAAAFAYVPALILLLTAPAGRKQLKTPWPYLAFALGLAFLMPQVLWNASHGWVYLKHELGHAKVAVGFSLSAASFGEFVASQLGVITPVLFVLILYAVIKRFRQDPFSFWFSIPILAAFALQSVHGKVQANWALVGYISAIPPFAAFYLGNFAALGRHSKNLVVAGVAIAAVFTLVGLCPSIPRALGAPPALDPLAHMNGARALALEVTRIDQAMPGPHFIFSDKYQTASELAFYVKGRPVTYCVNLGRRMNQYDLWPGFETLRGYDAVFVTERPIPPKLAAAFREVEPRPLPASLTETPALRRFHLYICFGLTQMPPAPPLNTY